MTDLKLLFARLMDIVLITWVGVIFIAVMAGAFIFLCVSAKACRALLEKEFGKEDNSE